MIPDIYRLAQQNIIWALVSHNSMMGWLERELGGVGATRFDPDGRIAFVKGDREITALANPIASVAVEPNSVLWAWEQMKDNPWVDQMPASAYRRFGQRIHCKSLDTPEVTYQVDYGEADSAYYMAEDICHGLIGAFGPGVHYWSHLMSKPGSRYVYLLSDWSKWPPKVTSEQLFTSLNRILIKLSDIDWALLGLADRLGWDFKYRDENEGDSVRRRWRMEFGENNWLEVLRTQTPDGNVNIECFRGGDWLADVSGPTRVDWY